MLILNAKRHEIIIAFLWEFSFLVIIIIALILNKSIIINHAGYCLLLIILAITDLIFLKLIRLEKHITDYNFDRPLTLIYKFKFKSKILDFIFSPKSLFFITGIIFVILDLINKYLIKK